MAVDVRLFDRYRSSIRDIEYWLVLASLAAAGSSVSCYYNIRSGVQISTSHTGSLDLGDQMINRLSSDDFSVYNGSTTGSYISDGGATLGSDDVFASVDIYIKDSLCN